jgi:hypothetical protein
VLLEPQEVLENQVQLALGQLVLQVQAVPQGHQVLRGHQVQLDHSDQPALLLLQQLLPFRGLEQLVLLI